MRIYLAGHADRAPALEAARSAGSPPLLVSYYDIARQPVIVRSLANWGAKCFLDSGAFTAASLGALIDLGALADFYLTHAGMFDAVSNLDVIGDAKASERNLIDLRNRGVPALPVWHLSSSMDELNRMCADHPRLALGGMVPYARKPAIRDAVLRRAWEVIYRHWPRRVHGFGLTSPRLLALHPWHTVDSTAALKLGAFGRVLSDDGTARKVRASRLDKLSVNAAMMQHLGRRVTAEWAKKGVVWND